MDILSYSDRQKAEREKDKKVFRGLTPSPDRTFLRKLREIDPNLRVKFKRDRGKFVILQPRHMTQGGGEAEVLTVEGGENAAPARGRSFRSAAAAAP